MLPRKRAISGTVPHLKPCTITARRIQVWSECGHARRIEVDADTYEECRRKLEAEVPTGCQVLSYRVDRDAKY